MNAYISVFTVIAGYVTLGYQFLLCRLLYFSMSFNFICNVFAEFSSAHLFDELRTVEMYRGVAETLVLCVILIKIMLESILLTLTAESVNLS